MEAMNVTENSMTLEELNDAEVQRLVPTIVYLLTISVLGIFGNSLVIHIYRTRYKQSNSKCFILCLSAIDLFSCCISIPFEVTTILEQYTFSHLWLCKCSRCFNTFGTCSSAFILLFIAIDRFRKVCKPFAKQIKNTVAKYLCVLSILLSAMLSLPAFFIYGMHTFEIPEFNLTGTECSTADEMQGQPYPMINSLMFGMLFITQIVCMSILYCFIGHEVKKHARKMHKMSQKFDKNPPSSVTEAFDSRISGEIIPDVTAKYDIVKTKNKELKKKRLSHKNNAYSEDSWTDKKDFELSFTQSQESKVKDSLKEMKRIDADVMGDIELEKQNSDSEDSGIKVKEDTDRENDQNAIEEIDEQDKYVNDRNDTEDEENESNEQHELNRISIVISTSEEKEDGMKEVGEFDDTSPVTSSESIPNHNENKFRRRLSSIGSRISQAFVRLASVVSIQTDASNGTVKRTQFLKQARARKTAFLMFVITLAFILSFLPHLVLMILRQVMGNFVQNLSDNNLAVYKFFLRSYFLNCAINPIIYSVCDSRFRASCKNVFLTCCGCIEN